MLRIRQRKKVCEALHIERIRVYVKVSCQIRPLDENSVVGGALELFTWGELNITCTACSVPSTSGCNMRPSLVAQPCRDDERQMPWLYGHFHWSERNNLVTTYPLTLKETAHPRWWPERLISACDDVPR